MDISDFSNTFFFSSNFEFVVVDFRLKKVRTCVDLVLLKHINYIKISTAIFFIMISKQNIKDKHLG